MRYLGGLRCRARDQTDGGSHGRADNKGLEFVIVVPIVVVLILGGFRTRATLSKRSRTRRTSRLQKCTINNRTKASWNDKTSQSPLNNE